MKLTVVNIKDLKIRKSKDPVSLPLHLTDWTFLKCIKKYYSLLHLSFGG